MLYDHLEKILCAPKEYQKNTLKLKIAILRNIIRIHMLRDHKKKYILCGPKQYEKLFQNQRLDTQNHY